MTARAPVVQREVKSPGLVVRTFRAIARVISVLFLALVFSILLEWIGMILWWPEEGVRHSERMLARELQYLNDGFTRSLVGERPTVLAGNAADSVEDALRYLGVGRLTVWLQSPEPGTGGSQAIIHDLLRGSRKYIEAMTNTMQTFAVRLTVLALATPVFALFGLVGLAEGLMRRDLRRWGGGRESSFLYHHSKKLLAPSILSAWMLYLAAPFSVHPNTVLLPFAALFAIGVALTMGTFKKYL